MNTQTNYENPYSVTHPDVLFPEQHLFIQAEDHCYLAMLSPLFSLPVATLVTMVTSDSEYREYSTVTIAELLHHIEMFQQCMYPEDYFLEGVVELQTQFN